MPQKYWKSLPLMEKIKLTQYSKAAGCGCKIAPDVLHQILESNFEFESENLLVGNSTNDDAAVYDLGNGQCLISTTDFFTPIVDDPFDFGRVAATNAISDIYAMGGKPILAISILSWPVDTLSPSLAARVLEGAREQCKKAGIAIAGGHSIAGTDPVFGLAVNGIIEKKNIKLNHTVGLGDKIYFTKSLGTGIYSTALKKGILSAEDYQESLNSLTTLNTIGYELGKLDYITAMTDVTGFSFVGHMIEMVGNSSLTAVIKKNEVGKFSNIMHYINQHIYPGNTTKNFNAFKNDVEGMEDLEFLIYCDPQTAGGLLFTVKSDYETQFDEWLHSNKHFAKKIGEIRKGTGKKVKLI